MDDGMVVIGIFNKRIGRVGRWNLVLPTFFGTRGHCEVCRRNLLFVPNLDLRGPLRQSNCIHVQSRTIPVNTDDRRTVGIQILFSTL